VKDAISECIADHTREVLQADSLCIVAPCSIDRLLIGDFDSVIFSQPLRICQELAIQRDVFRLVNFVHNFRVANKKLQHLAIDLLVKHDLRYMSV
jgi:hypothetical protein